MCVIVPLLYSSYPMIQGIIMEKIQRIRVSIPFYGVLLLLERLAKEMNNSVS